MKILAVVFFATIIACLFPGCASPQTQQQQDLEALYQMKQYDVAIQEMESQILASRIKSYETTN